MKSFSLLMLALMISPVLTVQTYAQSIRYKCPSCGRYHVQNASTTVQANGNAVVQRASQVGMQTSPSSVVTASSTGLPSSSPKVQSKRWRFENANKWARRIDPNAQAWAQQEANRLAQRGYQGYLQNGHPGGNNPYGSVTGTGTTFPGADLIHTCEGSSGMTLVAEAAAVSHDGRIYGVRSWR